MGEQTPDGPGAPADSDAAATAADGGEPVGGNEIEVEITKIWQELLGIPNVGLHDNFFELGGDSLIFLQVTTRLRDKYGISSSFRDIFDRNTVAKLAAAVMQEMADGVEGDELQRMISEIGELSEDELREALSAESGEA